MTLIFDLVNSNDSFVVDYVKRFYSSRGFVVVVTDHDNIYLPCDNIISFATERVGGDLNG